MTSGISCYYNWIHLLLKKLTSASSCKHEGKEKDPAQHPQTRQKYTKEKGSNGKKDVGLSNQGKQQYNKLMLQVQKDRENNVKVEQDILSEFKEKEKQLNVVKEMRCPRKWKCKSFSSSLRWMNWQTGD